MNVLGRNSGEMIILRLDQLGEDAALSGAYLEVEVADEVHSDEPIDALVSEREPTSTGVTGGPALSRTSGDRSGDRFRRVEIRFRRLTLTRDQPAGSVEYCLMQNLH